MVQIYFLFLFIKTFLPNSRMHIFLNVYKTFNTCTDLSKRTLPIYLFSNKLYEIFLSRRILFVSHTVFRSHAPNTFILLCRINSRIQVFLFSIYYDITRSWTLNTHIEFYFYNWNSNTTGHKN